MISSIIHERSDSLGKSKELVIQNEKFDRQANFLANIRPATSFFKDFSF